MMGPVWAGVMVLIYYCAPCSGFDFREPLVCYFLDGILMIYSLVVTAFFLRERFCSPSRTKEPEGIYQELNIQEEADPYQVLDHTKQRRKRPKKKRRDAASAQNTDAEAYECLAPSTSAAPTLHSHSEN